jgi:hypothetical protein
MKLTIFHDGRFWVAVIEVINGEDLAAFKHIFSTEPTDTEVLAFVNENLHKLTSEKRSSQASIKIEEPDVADKKRNPKRAAREAAKALQERGVSTYAQEALKAQIESVKGEKRIISKQNKEELKDRKYEIARQKAKDRHKGR